MSILNRIKDAIESVANALLGPLKPAPKLVPIRIRPDATTRRRSPR